MRLPALLLLPVAVPTQAFADDERLCKLLKAGVAAVQAKDTRLLKGYSDDYSKDLIGDCMSNDQKPWDKAEGFMCFPYLNQKVYFKKRTRELMTGVKMCFADGTVRPRPAPGH